MSDYQNIEVVNARENNLKSLSLSIPHNNFIVITGLSGSGKSTLAFDTIYTEGARRYIETFSPYTRQFLDRLHRPAVDAVHGIRPAIALEQENRTTSSRSTVGTITELNEYLKLVWSYLSIISCPHCGTTVENITAVSGTETALAAFSNAEDGFALVCFPVRLEQATFESLRQVLQSEGFVRVINPRTGRTERLEDFVQDETGAGELLVVVERVQLGPDAKDGLASALRQAFRFGHGRAEIFPGAAAAPMRGLTLREGLNCPGCSAHFERPKSSLFSFNNPIGACKTCQGFGKVLKISEELCIPDTSLSIARGAVSCWNSKSTRKEHRKLKSFCEANDIPLDQPWCAIPQALRNMIFNGKPGDRTYRGIDNWFEKLKRKRHKMHVRVFLSRYRSEFECPECRGNRLTAEAMIHKVSGLSLPQLWQMTFSDALPFFDELSRQHKKDDVISLVLAEIVSRLSYLHDIGVGYLTFDRQTRTLSGGESQRVNLTSILGARLVNTVIVLDEPTIGLHPADNSRLITALRRLKERDNSVIVVEHDQDVICAADQVLEVGPGSGSHGGELVFQGTAAELARRSETFTGRYLSGALEVGDGTGPGSDRVSTDGKIKIVGARAHNLKGIDVEIPLGRFVVLAGLSGSGKSTLINECLYLPYKRGAGEPTHTLSRLEGLEQIDEVVLIDQNPVGKTPRSNAATYTKAWEVIRECFAETEEAKKLGLSKSSFSFNVEGGRCSVCSGAGYTRVEMQFLADVFVECDACGGSRFKDAVLNVRFGGKNVSDILHMSLADVSGFFSSIGEEERAQKIVPALQPLLDLGLGYLTLGQPLSKLSGGEAQRVKLASFLGEKNRRRLLFILDEPTTGLHPHNIKDLFVTFRRLLNAGHSVLCIEHNLELIAEADHLIELGPGAGESGGELVAAGPLAQLLEKDVPNSATLRLLHERSSRRGIGLKLPARPCAEPAGGADVRKQIEIAGARHHNLRDLSVSIPENCLAVVTGVSGSGKSSLAFDIIFAEGQRRYIDCLSPYARQFITKLHRADVDLVRNIPPTISVSQKSAAQLGISTIATTTEVYQYLRLLYSKLGEQHCPEHDAPITTQSSESIVQQIEHRFSNQRIFLFAPVVSGRKGYHNELFNRALQAEIHEARIDGQIVSLHPELRLERNKLHYVSLLVASLTVSGRNRSLLLDAVNQALLFGNGVVEVASGSRSAEPQTFSTARVCPVCFSGFRELDPQDFSFRSARGACDECGGHGYLEDRKGRQERCPLCEGARIKPLGRHVYIGAKAINELTALTAPKLLKFLSGLDFGRFKSAVFEPIMHELRVRLELISRVGLDYLELDRSSSSISGGENQRLRLARALGSPLTGICYVLDEPTVGLHPAEHERLMQTLTALRDSGNTVIVVEHDEDTILSADYIVDIGPRGGAEGGRLVYQGNLQGLFECGESLTGRALAQRGRKERHGRNTSKPAEWIEISGARANNLKRLDVKFPAGRLSVVAGVSGAGKSSLIHHTLIPAIHQLFTGESEDRQTWDDVELPADLERIVEIDQTPIGKTSASTPASYLGIYDQIRKVYAMLPEAKARGWSASHFSFNSGDGRCKTCSGRGFVVVPMSFLPDAATECEDCRGMRFDDPTLEVEFQGLSIGALLKKTMTEARLVFANHPSVRRPLDYIDGLGLGYLTLGQPSHTLSGGEAQRLKIARELGLREAKNTLYILDEPTIGLHMVDVDRLTNVLKELVAKGNTVIVIEHNLEVIQDADYLVEIGPGPGNSGGRLLFAGPPENLAKSKKSTPTAHYLRRAAVS